MYDREKLRIINLQKKDFKCLKDNLVYYWDTLVAKCENGPLFEPHSRPNLPILVLSLFQGDFMTLKSFRISIK